MQNKSKSEEIGLRIGHVMAEKAKGILIILFLLLWVGETQRMTEIEWEKRLYYLDTRPDKTFF